MKADQTHTKIIQNEITRNVEFLLGVAIRGPLAAGTYTVGDAMVDISYSKSVYLVPASMSLQLPYGFSTCIRVSWTNTSTDTDENFKNKYWGRDRKALHTSLAITNQLFLAFKLARTNYADTIPIRTVGEADVLYYCSYVNGENIGQINAAALQCRFTESGELIPDPNGITPEALHHVDTHPRSYPRKFVRAIELLEHGYYTEALIVIFAVLDDTVQEVLKRELSKKGLEDPESFLRGIKESRLQHFLGPVLKLAAGKSIEEMWVESQSALAWLNKNRNQAMHAGFIADRRTAAFAVLCVLLILRVLEKERIVELGIDHDLANCVGFFANCQVDKPDWIASGLNLLT